MARNQATQDQIHAAIVARLIDRIPEFSAATCFVSDEPYPGHAPPKSIFCTVSPSDGVFPDGFFAGGGTLTLTEQTEILVSVFSDVRLGESGHAASKIFHARHGLVAYYKPKILRALLLDWEPTFDANELLRDMLSPVRCLGPREFNAPGADQPWLQMTLSFSVSFDWDLSE